MGPAAIRSVVFWTSLLLALCILDSKYAGLPEAPRTSKPVQTFTLRISPLLEAEASQGDARHSAGPFSWTTRLFQEEEQQVDGRPMLSGFRPIGHAQGTLAEGQRGVAEMRLSQGRYWAITRAAGAIRVAERIVIDADLLIEPILRPESKLRVRVLVEEKETLTPLSGATVLVGDPETLNFGAQTDAEGRAEIDALPSGPQLVRIFAPGYEPYEAMAERELLVRLRPVSTLRVSVVDEGKPVPGARVLIAGVQLWPARSTTTDPRGFVDITGLKPGRYSLYAEKGSRVSEPQKEAEVQGESGVVLLELSLRPGRTLRLLVQSEEDEEPIVGARITWSSAGLGQFSRHATTGPQGVAQIGPLNENGGSLHVRAQGFVGRMVPVEAAQDALGPQVIGLVRAGVVEGRVVDPEGFPVSGASVEIAGTDAFGMPVSVTFQSEEITDAHFDWALRSENTLIPAGELGVMLGPVPPIPLGDVVLGGGRSLTTGERGYFRAEGVPPGELVVLVRHPDYMDGRSEVLLLTPGGQKKTQVTLGRGERLRGRVLDAAGFPVQHARVQVSARKFDRRVTTATDGTFELPAAPHEVRVSVSLIEQPLRTIFSREVEATERKEEIQIELPESRKPAQVRVVDESDEGIALAQVSLISLEPEIPFKQTRFTSDDGSVEFLEAQELRVRLVVSAPGFVERSLSQTLTEDTRLELAKSVPTFGKITAVRGRLPASGAEVVFKAAGLLRRTRSDELGEYHFTGLPPGKGELSASHPEYGTGRARVSVKDPQDGREAELPALDLSPPLEIEGRVEDGAGRPINGALIARARISPYLSSTSSVETLGVSDENGEFKIAVERGNQLHLYAAKPAQAFGWSEMIRPNERDSIEGVVILVDQEDKCEPDVMGTLLAAFSEAPAPRVYAVAEGSSAARGGLRVDDELIEIDGRLPQDIQDARDLLSGLPGTDLRLLVRRAGSLLELVVSREGFLR